MERGGPPEGPGGSRPILEIKDLHVNFYMYDGVVRAIDGVSLTINEGETYGLVGETGCGKSVTARSILRLIPDPPGRITRGAILYRGDDLLDGIEEEAVITEHRHGARIRRNKRLIRKNERWMTSIRGRGISMIFQEPMSALNPVFSIGDQLAEVFLVHQRRALLERVFRSWTDEGVRDAVRDLVGRTADLSDMVKEVAVEGTRRLMVRPSDPGQAHSLARALRRSLKEHGRHDIFMHRVTSVRPDARGRVILRLRYVNPIIRWIYRWMDRTEEVRERTIRLQSSVRRETQRVKRQLGEHISREGLRGIGGNVPALCESAESNSVPTGDLLPRYSSLRESERRLALMELPERFFRRWFKTLYNLVMRQVTVAALGDSYRMLRLVNVPHPGKILDMYPFELSGGMQQRAMIAMALSCNPSLLLADEPTTALDVTIQAQILELMKDLKRKVGASIMLITHDLGVVAEMCSRIGVMYAGTIVEEGLAEEIFHDPKHPYTTGLLSAIPKMEGRVDRLPIIGGSVPNLIQPPTGCRFHPRCPHAMKACTLRKPPDLQITPSHRVACYLYAPDLSVEERTPLASVREEVRPARPLEVASS